MEQPQVINTLNVKRKEIEAHIGSLEQDLQQARRDLSALIAAIQVFSAEGVKVTAYMNLARLFPRNTLPVLCRAAFDKATEPISTKDIAAYVILDKGLDLNDRYLRKAISLKVIHLLRRWELERRIVRFGKQGTAVVWQLQLSKVINQSAKLR